MLRALGLGDFLAAVPALRALRAGLPEHRLVLAAPRVLEPLVRLSGAVDAVHDTTGLRPLAWRGEPPQVAVNLHGRGPQSHRLLMDLAPGRLVAFGSSEAGVAGPEWEEDEHEVVRWCRLVTESLGVPASPRDLALAAPDVPAPVPGAVVVHPGAACPSRRWPPERFGEVARWARDQGWPVAVTGTSAEADLGEEVRRVAGLPRQCVLAGRTTLPEMAALVREARLVVCGDTGTAHLATAYATPSVVLFGPVPPSRWGPPPGGPHAVLWHGDGEGDPWAEHVDPALAAVTVTEVLERAEAMTRGAETGRRTTPASA